MSKIPVEPEDYGLSSHEIKYQAEQVTSAEERQRLRDMEDDEALEEIAKVWKNRPIDDDWDPNSHPLFMDDIGKEKAADNPFADAMEQLAVEDPPEVKAEDFKLKGNAALKRGPKYYSDAIDFYDQAIACKSPDQNQNSILLSNRAAVQLLKKNYGKVLEDCSEAIKLNPENSKAYYRGAKAANSLKKFERAIELCTEGIKVDPENKEMAKEKTVAEAGKKKKDDEARAKKAAEAKALVTEGKKTRFLRKACSDRGLIMGESCYEELARAAEPFLDDEGLVHWPVLLLYDQFDQSDFLSDVMEDCTVGDIVATVLDPAAPRADWDVDEAYVAGKVNVYYATHQSRPLEDGSKKKGAAGSDESFLASLLGGSERKGVEKEIERQAKSEWVKVDLNEPLIHILREKDHVIPGQPVFHVVPADSFYERHFLSNAPDKV